MHKAIVLSALVAAGRAHMSPFLKSMYGGPLQYPDLGENPVAPLGPGLEYDDWWFRGPKVRNAPPEDGEIALLPAGGNFTLEIACAPEYTTYDGSDPNGNVACDDPGPYHADPEAVEVNKELLSGCAIGIADVMDPNLATMDDFVIISVQQTCVWTRNTTFSIPAKMPACTGDYCICGWVWSPQTGTANAYHTPFRCKITDTAPDALPIATPSDPVYCPDSREDCTKGAKRLISTYNYPVNVPFTSNYDRPGYHDTFGFFDGAQDDIFIEAPITRSSTVSPPVLSSLSSSLVSSATSMRTSLATQSASTRASVSTASSVTTTRATARATSSYSSSLALFPISSSPSPSFSSSSSSSPSSSAATDKASSKSTSSKLVWTEVVPTTPHWIVVPTPRTTTVTTSPTSIATGNREPIRDRNSTTRASTQTHRLPFRSRTTTTPTPTPTRRKTWHEREKELGLLLDIAIAHKALSHLDRRSTFGSDDGIAGRVVERMRRRVRKTAPKAEPPALPVEQMVWTRVEL
ncbi:uncharacterized protein JCM15063_001534 [Sporobolomyces koalae]|uniref:uncharacterized protein n=1 Tax=Sporobolomyces koalae TaxID=500713 RepID=UPI00317578D5